MPRVVFLFILPMMREGVLVGWNPATGVERFGIWPGSLLLVRQRSCLTATRWGATSLRHILGVLPGQFSKSKAFKTPYPASTCLTPYTTAGPGSASSWWIQRHHI
jgi:hypothetical protein